MHLLLLILFKFYFVTALKPVVLMPGLIGSQLEARFDKSKTEHGCRKKQDWHSLWLNKTKLKPLHIDCFLENFKLEVQNDGTTKNREGVEIRCPRFGDTFAVEYLEPYNKKSKSRMVYFANFVNRLVNNSMGYVRNQSIRGAPYDFRKAPNEMAEYLDNLTKLIVETYEKNGQKRVVMLGHSMGCMYTLYFLNHKDQAWKDKYVEAFIAVGGPWHGSVLTLKAITSGDDFGLAIDPFSKIAISQKIRGLARTMPSISWLMPSSDAWKSETLVRGLKGIKAKSYTVNDYKELFDDVNFKNGTILRRNTENLTKSLEYPGVKIYCIFSSIPNSTPDSFDYLKSAFSILPWYNRPPHVIKGDGDGIVNLRSLEACKKWPNITWNKFNVEHRIMMNNTDIQDYIIDILKELNDI